MQNMGRISKTVQWGMLICIATMFAYYAFFTATTSDGTGITSQGVVTSSKLRIDKRCQTQDVSQLPVIFKLRTKLGVNYDAGHWFHMSENFMTQHSILRASGQLTNASTVIYIFDKAGFSNGLNAITRFMIYLGTKAPRSLNHKLYFIDNNFLDVHDNSHPGTLVTLDKNILKHAQMVDLSANIPTEQRFAALTSFRAEVSASGLRAAQLLANGNMSSGITGTSADSGSSIRSGATESISCAQYVATIGGMWPTPQRGHWFPNEGDITSYRTKMRDACPADATQMELYKKHKKFKMVIYQRDLSRKLSNLEEAIAMMRTKLSEEDWEIMVLMHDNNRGPCSLAHIVGNADVLVTPHGFQSMLLMYLPRPALIFEVFPYRYYKRGYGPFGGEYGVRHAGVMSPPTFWHTKIVLSFVTTMWCMTTGGQQCREYARSQDVIFTELALHKLMVAIDKYHITDSDLVMTPLHLLADGSAPGPLIGERKGVIELDKKALQTMRDGAAAAGVQVPATVTTGTVLSYTPLDRSRGAGMDIPVVRDFLYPYPVPVPVPAVQ